MKKFFFNFFWFLLLFSIIIHVWPLYQLYTGEYKQTVAGAEIYRSLLKSKKKSRSKKVLLGDSGAYQLFPNTIENDTINSLACNQAISLVGHYILLNNYLQAGNKADTVIMLFSPYTFRNNLDQVFTYHYFIKPFFIDEYKPLLTKTVYEQVDKIPFYQLSHYPIILTSNWAPDYIPNGNNYFTFLSPVAKEYLTKIKALSEKYHFSIEILATPLSITQKATNNKINKNETLKTGLGKNFESYFKHIIYLPDSNFIDKFHLKHPERYTEYYKSSF